MRDALPHVVQVADRWHLRHGMCDDAGKEVAAHSACWASVTGLRRGQFAETTLQRWHQVHALREAGVGLLDCSRRLGLALSTVKRYARAATPERVQRVPEYRVCMVDPYRDHLRVRREQQSGVENLAERQRERLEALVSACPEMAAPAAAVLSPREDDPARLAAWITAAREAELPHVHSFVRGIDQDIAARHRRDHPRSPQRTHRRREHQTKLLKRQMYGRVGIALLRHRILLGQHHRKCARAQF